MAYKFPPSLKLLDCYLKQKGIDTSSLRSDRHAFGMLLKTTGIKLPFPRRGKSCYVSLRCLHADLFPNVPMKKAPTVARRVHGIGQTGPASDCRTVTPETWAELARKYEKLNAIRYRVGFSR